MAKNNVVESPVSHIPVRSKTIERQGSSPVPFTVRHPKVSGGICEFCGVIDRNQPSEVQYRLCPHYKDIGQLRCSYCDASKDPVEVVGHHALNIAEHPENPDKLIVWCNQFNCSEAHRKRFSPSGK